MRSERQGISSRPAWEISIGRIDALVRLLVLLLFVGTISTYTLTDSGPHQRLATYASLAAAAQSDDHRIAVPHHQTAVHSPAPAVVETPLQLFPCRVGATNSPIRSSGRYMSWADSGVGHMLLTDE
jgi:uncharacterized membrane protein